MHPPPRVMQIWHDTADTSAAPQRIQPGTRLELVAGTRCRRPGHRVDLELEVTHADGSTMRAVKPARWTRTQGANSYWRSVCSCAAGDRIAYRFHALTDATTVASTPWFHVRAGPALHVALIWHHHQPAVDACSGPRPVHFRAPWVRLHALRDYLGMAVLAREVPELHLTINLPPGLLRLIEEYADHGATDEHLRLTTIRAESLHPADREEILQTFFSADWHHQVFPHARYAALFARRRDDGAFSPQDLRDLQMWSNLAWFAAEFREGDVELPDGTAASVRHWVDRGEAFSHEDVLQMVAEQRRVLRAVIPLHRALQEAGQIEVSTTPFVHPVLPLPTRPEHLWSDNRESTPPRSVARPDDPDSRLRCAVEEYSQWFGSPPRGMWLREGALTAGILRRIEQADLQWVGADESVLVRDVPAVESSPRVDAFCTPYREALGPPEGPALVVRAPQLSGEMLAGFGQWAHPTAAAAALVGTVLGEFAARVSPAEDRLLTIVLDGHAAWGRYRRDGRPFLRALYKLLSVDPDLVTVTPAEYFEGNPGRGIHPHPAITLPAVHVPDRARRSDDHEPSPRWESRRSQAWPAPSIGHDRARPPVRWRVVAPRVTLGHEDQLTVESGCPALLVWSLDAGLPARVPLEASQGGVSGATLWGTTIGPFAESATELHLAVRCMSAGCDGRCPCAGAWSIRFKTAAETGDNLRGVRAQCQ